MSHCKTTTSMKSMTASLSHWTLTSPHLKSAASLFPLRQNPLLRKMVHDIGQSCQVSINFCALIVCVWSVYIVTSPCWADTVTPGTWSVFYQDFFMQQVDIRPNRALGEAQQADSGLYVGYQLFLRHRMHLNFHYSTGTPPLPSSPHLTSEVSYS